MRRASAIVFASVVIACGARTGLRTTGDAAPPAALVDGIVLKACAPNDGPALSFSLGTPVPSCQIPGIGTGVIILIWNPLPTGPGTFTIGDGSFTSGSSGYVCESKNTCAQASGGTLVLTELTPTSASGSYTLTTTSGTTSASFEGVAVCPNAEMCG